MARTQCEERLTERDIEFLRFLHKTRVMTTEQAKQYYPPTYVYVRLKKLCDRGYIERQYKYLLITDRGVSAAGIIDPTPARKIVLREKSQGVRLAEIHASTLNSGWQFLNSREVKNIYELNYTAHINAVVRNDEAACAIYLVNKADKGYLRKIEREINRLNGAGINEALVLYNGRMPYLYNNFNKIKHVYVHPAAHGFQFWLRCKKGLINNIYSRMFGDLDELTHSDMLGTDYEVEIDGETFYVGQLISGDVTIFEQIEEYYDDWHSRFATDVILLVTPEQEEMAKKRLGKYPVTYKLIQLS